MTPSVYLLQQLVEPPPGVTINILECTIQSLPTFSPSEETEKIKREYSPTFFSLMRKNRFEKRSE
ncbi:hypothetical protein EXN66_Car020488 [Channa argus]|uniref:Uncharacterized protein n=1 Tax=Channa argus TaxID=215402 RepID=A0A6G1QRF0_CHAAH|nr:hypothetical protein EXN66_Car020488 [Channa argus]